MKKADLLIAASLALLALQKRRGSSSGAQGLSLSEMSPLRSGDHVARIAPNQVLYDSKGIKYRVDYVWKCIPTLDSVYRSKVGEHMVQMSNWPNGEPNPLYDKDFQARDLTSQMQKGKIDRIVAEFDPNQMTLPSPVPTLGPPVVWTARDWRELLISPDISIPISPTSLVLAGNGRLLALSRLDSQQYGRYLQAIEVQYGPKALTEFWSTNVPCNLEPGTEPLQGYRSVLVREVFHPDGTPLSYSEAKQLAGNSQGSVAGAESRLGGALSLFRGLNISGSLPFISAPFPLKRDTISQFLDKNPTLWSFILNKLNPTLRSQLLRGGKEAEERKYEILSAVLVGYFLPSRIISEGFSSEKEAQALLGFLPVLGAIHQRVKRGLIYSEYDLLPNLVSAREFSQLTKGWSYRKAIELYEETCRSGQMKMFSDPQFRAKICELDQLGVGFALFIKRSTQLADPTSIVGFLTKYMFEAEQDDPRQMTLCGLGGSSGEALIQARQNRAFNLFKNICLPKNLGKLI